MTEFSCSTTPSRPRWDGSRLLFDIADGGGQVPCAISRAALEDIAGARCFTTASLMERFAGARERIESLALDKLRARPDGITGRLNLWADDVDAPPPDGEAVAATGAPPAV